jgi:PAS domain S-box-containing protein
MICNENGTPCDLRYLAMNPAFERQTGLKAADVVGHTMLELFRHVEPVWIERYGKVALTGEPAHFEEWFGALGKWFEVHAFQTEPGRFGVVFADVTERKNTEDALRRAHDELEVRVAERTAELQRRAEQLAMLTSELTLAEQRERRRLAQVLHDHLQQLLVGAKFGLEVLARRVEEEQRPNVDQIRDLLDESIIASRSLTVELSPPILHEAGLAAGLEWLARWMKEKHGLDVELKLDPQVATDREDVKVLLFQSVRELLFNVVKHAHVTRATVEMRPSGPDTLRVEVSDAGVGFEPQEMWERSSHMAGGFGLISIRERLGMLGGTLEIVSSPQAGARFILTAPARAAAPATAIGAAAPAVSPGRPFAATPAAAPGQIRVMLADDHAVMRQGLAALLGEQDDIVVVGQAANGQEAVDLAGHLRPDIILMDYSMPVLDGLEATRRIHADWPEIRIIGLSMYEEADRAAAMLAAGAAAYLTKSGDPAQLLAQIRNRPGL